MGIRFMKMEFLGKVVMAFIIEKTTLGLKGVTILQLMEKLYISMAEKTPPHKTTISYLKALQQVVSA